ncbi:hypothetical protein GEV33_000266 [Tenebrio molitor]|uniref:Uncharacterized protein n=1 Tax=Tenebrio molitor TaxID=7067 RepID=A0A8J6HXJ1_TENMO|nr:hypothetical protein GEV33_000266 [Tenebrio molitor]
MSDDHTLLDDYNKFKSRNADPSIGGECDDSCKKNILLLFLAICPLSTCEISEDLLPLKDALSGFFITDQEPEDFRGVLSRHPFRHLFRTHIVENSVVCFLCNTVFDLMIAKRALKGSRESFLTDLTLVCTLLNIEPERVCRGALENYIVS